MSFLGFFFLTVRKVCEVKKTEGSETKEEEVSHWDSISDRIKRYRGSRQMPTCMFIIIPESCFCPHTLEGDGLKSMETPLLCSASRAGNPHRDYKISVYKLTDPSDGKVSWQL